MESKGARGERSILSSSMVKCLSRWRHQTTLHHIHQDAPLIAPAAVVWSSANTTAGVAELLADGPVPVRRNSRRGAFIQSHEHSGGWIASLAIAPTALSQVPLFTVVQLQHAQLDAAPSDRLQDLSRFKKEEIAVMYEGLLTQIDELHTAYAGLLSHLTIALEVSLETESHFRKCFFLQHNLAAQFEMLGMNRCAHHSRDVESRLALVPPVHREYPLHELSEDASQQMQCLWNSPLLLLQLVTTYQFHMARKSLPLPT